MSWIHNNRTLCAGAKLCSDPEVFRGGEYEGKPNPPSSLFDNHPVMRLALSFSLAQERRTGCRDLCPPTASEATDAYPPTPPIFPTDSAFHFTFSGDSQPCRDMVSLPCKGTITLKDCVHILMQVSCANIGSEEVKDSILVNFEVACQL